MKKYFGTDGIRGEVGIAPITPDIILKLAMALGSFLQEKFPNQNNINILIAKDTRISSDMIESALKAGLSASGVNIKLLGVISTPALAYFTKIFNAHIGIVITASHNNPKYNGIKLFSNHGFKINNETQLYIDKYLYNNIVHYAHFSKIGKVTQITDIAGRYIEFCKSIVPFGFSLKDYKIVIDCANGAAYNTASIILNELGAKVITINNSPNGININKNCGSIFPQEICNSVLQHQADVGITLDGDADRVIMCDHNANIINGDQILYIIAKYLKLKNDFYGGVVGTCMSNVILEEKLKQLHIPFIRSDVGDRNISNMLKKYNWFLGGESSGHIINLNKHVASDGIISALQILTAMIYLNKSLAELANEIILVPNILHNVYVDNPQQVLQNIEFKTALMQAKQHAVSKSRIVVRASGTENCIRILLEGKDMKLNKKIVSDLEDSIRKLT